MHSALVLKTGAPVRKVSAFYTRAWRSGQWKILGSTRPPHSANIRARRGRTGVTVQISTTGSGSTVSVTSHPV